MHATVLETDAAKKSRRVSEARGSPARGAADPAGDLSGAAAFDIDGQPRVNPADIGADEVP